jgi:beta-fructofuranosidase
LSVLDPTFPGLHVRPARGWLNDPNGLCRIDGRYHVFFQYNPDGPVHGNIHWGHVSSTDLLSWQEHPYALVPRPGGIDAEGCWSGCIIDDAGVPTAVYTANPGHPRDAGVALARSDRSLIEWTQGTATVVETPRIPGIEEARDPFLFDYDGSRYAIQGAGSVEGRPQLVLYGCDDLEHWSELGSFLTDDDPIAAETAPAHIWECPNLALIDGRWVLLISMWRWVDGAHVLAGVRYLIGDLQRVGDGLHFAPAVGGVLDDGPSFYAPQLLTIDGRTLLWGWAWELRRSPAQVDAAGWAGVLTFPRELYVRDGVLGSRPAAELAALRAGDLDLAQPFTDASFELIATGPVTLRLLGDDDQVVVAAKGTPEDPVRILVDGSMVELFHRGASYTTRAYPTALSRWSIEAEAEDVTGQRLAVEPAG